MVTNTYKNSTICIMKDINNNIIQKALLIYTNIDSLNQSEKLENSFEEFHTLVQSSGTEIIKTLKFMCHVVSMI